MHACVCISVYVSMCLLHISVYVDTATVRACACVQRLADSLKSPSSAPIHCWFGDGVSHLLGAHHMGQTGQQAPSILRSPPLQCKDYRCIPYTLCQAFCLFIIFHGFSQLNSGPQACKANAYLSHLPLALAVTNAHFCLLAQGCLPLKSTRCPLLLPPLSYH